MSWDFPDGPDYNPEPIEDDPWDVDTTSDEERYEYERDMRDLWLSRLMFGMFVGMAETRTFHQFLADQESLSAPTGADLRPTDPSTQE